MGPSDIDPTLIPIVAAGTGAVTGALTGGIVAYIIAPSKAEREERGKQRISGKREIASGFTDFQYAVLQARERRLDMDHASHVQNDLESAAVALAQVIQHGAIHLPRIKRWRLRRSVKNIVGPHAWRLAELRPQGMQSTAFDAATARADREVRPIPGQGLIPPATASPLDPGWNRLLHRVGKLQRQASRR